MTTMTQRLPRAVRLQNREAERLMAEAKKQQESGSPAPEPTPTPPPAPAPDNPAPVDGAPGPTPDPSPTPGEDTVETLKAKLAETTNRAETAEHRFKVLKGKYDAEVPRLAGQVADLTKRMDDMTKNPPKPQEPPSKKYLTDKDQALGEDMVDFTSRVARGEAEHVTRPLESKVQDMEATIGQLRHNAFMTAMDSTAVQGWRKINTMPQFIDWLEGVDRISGRTRSSLLQEASAQFDAVRAAAFFDQFAKETGFTAGKPSDGLARLAKPAPAGGAGAPPPAVSGKIWTEAEVTKFYTDVSRGMYKRNPEQAKKIEADITKASQEGRIRR